MRLAAIVLAAGSASRFGSNKLAASFRGEPLVRHAIRAARAAPVETVFAVSAPDCPIGDWDGTPPVQRVPLVSDSQSASLKAGIAAAQEAQVDGAFVFLGDMPLVPHGIAGRLAAELADNYAAIPRHDGVTGHPVLLSRQAFPDIARLEGDQGAGKLLRNRGDVVFLDCADKAIRLDIDRPEDLSRLEGF